MKILSTDSDFIKLMKIITNGEIRLAKGRLESVAKLRAANPGKDLWDWEPGTIKVPKLK